MKKAQMSIESYHKLNRSRSLLNFLRLDLIHQEINGIYQLYLPHLFTYIADDICFVLNELQNNGFCDDCLKK
ncbi:hypothetical protein CCS41_01640 [Candidatus Fukatsuia symbiotica]|uniref:Derepression protein n=1 Tax=Candidatus Fukatsuia symbiotica TaxID=1878942 RepID=A0A2U8I6J7_9GAMM|nr:hypothetical protein CCS41_01640 [Candidatus Fukatsuia symbiotica]